MGKAVGALLRKRDSIKDKILFERKFHGSKYTGNDPASLRRRAQGNCSDRRQIDKNRISPDRLFEYSLQNLCEIQMEASNALFRLIRCDLGNGNAGKSGNQKRATLLNAGAISVDSPRASALNAEIGNMPAINLSGKPTF